MSTSFLHVASTTTHISDKFLQIQRHMESFSNQAQFRPLESSSADVECSVLLDSHALFTPSPPRAVKDLKESTRCRAVSVDWDLSSEKELKTLHNKTEISVSTTSQWCTPLLSSKLYRERVNSRRKPYFDASKKGSLTMTMLLMTCMPFFWTMLWATFNYNLDRLPDDEARREVNWRRELRGNIAERDGALTSYLNSRRLMVNQYSSVVRSMQPAWRLKLVEL